MPHASPQPDLAVVDLGRLAYAPALARQRAVNQAVIDGEQPPTLLLVEHEPVVTITHRRTARAHLVAPAERLAALGIAVEETDRGGDMGRARWLNLGRYMRFLEQVVIDTLAALGVAGRREAGATGVWVDHPRHPGGAKVCAMGVRVRKNTTLHGLALNVRPDLRHFDTIIPCGLAGRAVTSLHDLLGERAPTMDEVKAQLVSVMQDAVRDATAARAGA